MSYTNPKRGIAVLIVLAILSITMALCYAMMRAEFMSSQIQLNYQRRADARLAAYTGLSIALQTIQSSDWAGVQTPLTRNLGEGQSCVVTFQTGDASLQPGDSDYEEFPYRLTLVSTGSVTDPKTSVVTSSFSVEAVVQFVRRKLYDAPANWSNITGYTLYQWGTDSEDTIDLDLPVRIEGPIYAQNKIELAKSYPGDGDDVPFAGQIDEVVFFGKALTDSQIRDLANRVITLGSLTSNSSLQSIAHWRLDESVGSWIAQDALDDHDGLFDGAKPGSAPVPHFGGSKSASFDGYNDHIHIDRVPLNGHEITILAWIKPTELSTINGRIISKATGLDENDHAWMLGTCLSGSNHRLRFRIKSNFGDTDTLVASTGNLSEGTWAFAAAVYDGESMRLFKDGVLVGTRSKSGNLPNTNSLHVSIGNNPPGSPRARLLRDLNTMRFFGGGDKRPVTGPIHAPRELTSKKVQSLLEDELKVTWNATTAGSSIPLTHPGQVLSYRLYPGGKVYNARILAATLRNVNYEPDPLTNPLGLCYRVGNLDIRENVQLDGVLIVNGLLSEPDVEIYGQNVQFNPTTLPPLVGTVNRLQLPTAVVKDDFRVYDSASGSVNGLVAAWDECGFQSGTEDATFTINGKLIVNQFAAQSRTEWNVSNSTWKNRTTSFMDQLADGSPVPFFPTWLYTTYGLDVTPKLVVKPESSNPTYHWPNWTQPVFVAHPDDGGLRWSVLDIREKND
jgi:hypothetical protein